MNCYYFANRLKTLFQISSNQLKKANEHHLYKTEVT